MNTEVAMDAGTLEGETGREWTTTHQQRTKVSDQLDRRDANHDPAPATLVRAATTHLDADEDAEIDGCPVGIY
jgi:hypothetical protein